MTIDEFLNRHCRNESEMIQILDHLLAIRMKALVIEFTELKKQLKA